jgi:hypothetical protein
VVTPPGDAAQTDGKARAEEEEGSWFGYCGTFDIKFASFGQNNLTT